MLYYLIMAEKKIIDIFPPQQKKEFEAIEEKPRIKFSLPKISPPRINPPAGGLKVVILAVFLITGGIFAYFSLGSAKIEIWPKLEPLSLDTKISVEKSAQSLDLIQKIVPGYEFEEISNVSGEFLATGKISVEKKAEGVIRVYNNSSVPQTLIANTRFQPPLEKFEQELLSQENPWFKLKSRIVIPAKSFQDAQVIADSPGEKYNIKPSKFSVPGLAGSSQYTLVFGESFNQFAGGEKKDFPKVLAEDLQNAQDDLFEKAKSQGEKNLEEKISKDYLFLEDALKQELTDSSSLAKIGDQSERFNYSVLAKSSILAPKYEDLQILMKNLLSGKLPQTKEMHEQSFDADYSLFSADKNLLKMSVSAKSSVSIFSPVQEISLKQGLLDKALESAKTILENQEDFERIKINLWPFWLRSIPKNIEKVKVEVRLDS